jgi:hypothetical protein
VVRAIECLGWDESKKEIKRQQIIPIGNQNSIIPDLIIYDQGNRPFIHGPTEHTSDLLRHGNIGAR